MHSNSNNIKIGSIYMISSALLFSLMQIFIAKTADTIPLFEQLFFRNFIAASVAFIYLSRKKIPVFGNKKNRPILVLRSVTGFLGMLTLFYATANASQGDVAILVKMTPFITIVCVAIFLKERIYKYQIISIIIAFVGAFIVSGPQFNSNIFPLIVAIISAVFGGVAYTFISLLKGKEQPWVIVFFFSFLSTLFVTPFLFFDFVIPNLVELLYLLGIGVCAAGGQILLTLSYTCAKAADVSIFNYFGIIFSMIFGFIFLGQIAPYTSILGAGFVILAGAVVFIANKSRNK